MSAHWSYWVVNASTKQAEPVMEYSRARIAAYNIASRKMRETGTRHFVMRCVAFTEVIVSENK
jgi:hypothetical protein